MTIDETQEAIIEEFARLGDDWMRVYEHLIHLGKESPELDSRHKTEDNLLRGCQSRVWLHTSTEAGKLYFLVDSDAFIIKGIAALLVKVLSGHTPEQVKTAELYFIDRIGLQSHLSPMRSNGLYSMVEEMKARAKSTALRK
ncbi:MAG TPA: SufE family protein [bacterium]|nr:SufE family protein [bacterium]